MIVSTSSATSGEDPKKARQAMLAMMGPGQADTMVRHAVHHCWMMLPDEKRNIAELRSQLLRLVNRAINDLQEDAAAFGQEMPEK